MRRSQVYRALDRCAGWLLPPRCVLCGAAGQPPAYDLCRECETACPTVPDPCPRCAMPRSPADQADLQRCGHCRPLDLPYTHCLAPWAYQFPVTQLVQSLKYEGALANARILGTRLARHACDMLDAAALHGADPLLVPLPLHASRLVERGFNQSREIARIVGHALDLPLAGGALRRVRATAPQVGLARSARSDNLRGAFAAEAAFVTGRTIVLLDDVVTTGSTAAEAAHALLVAGARSVQVWAAARALG